MIELTSELKSQVNRAAEIMKNGGVVAYPTDTVYGLGAAMNNATAIERIYRIKGRPKGMALPLLLSDIAQVYNLSKTVPQAALRLASAFFPGALTIILLKSEIVPDAVTSGEKTVAFRIPNHPVPLALVRAVGVPIVGTSANLSGRAPALTAAEVNNQIGDQVDMIIDGGNSPGGVESTIVDLSTEPAIIRREGAIPLERIRQILPLTITLGGT